MTTGMILDIAVILLLVPTIIYAVILNRRLSALRKSREELAKVVNSFNEATMRAEAGIPKLKKATTEANHTLKDRVEKAQTLRDDLAFMIERAEELATRLEGAARADARVAGPRDSDFPPPQRAVGGRAAAARAVNQSPAFDEERSEAERELLKALQSAR